MSEELEFVKELARRLDGAGIPYMLTGSLAMMVYSVTRMTRDIDIVIELGPGDVERFTRLFADDCYLDSDAAREAVSQRGMFKVIHQQWIVKADFIVRKDDSYHRMEFQRRRRLDFEGVPMSIAAPEDLILSKLVWARDADSDVQRRDVTELVKAAEDLDWACLQRWAVELGVADDLNKVKQI